MTLTRLGPYELLEEVGKGGMATVYRAYQASVDRHVALKVIHKAIASDEAALERFRREARLIARLEHPHILPIYDFDGTSEPPYIVMRYLDTGTLKDALKGEPLTYNDISFLLRQTASALDYAHEQGIVHRDIKPSNIMLDRKGNVIVSDFGIARMIGNSANSQSDATVGTPDYMPPEQVMGVADIDGRADVYSLAVMAFQMLTGQLPFTADTPLGVMMKHLQEAPPAPKRVNPALPVRVDEVLAQALSKAPADRYATASTFAAALTAALGAQTTTQTLKVSQTLKDVADADTDSKSTPGEQNKIVTLLAANAADFSEMLAEAKGAEAARRGLRQWRERVEQTVTARAGRLIKHDEHECLVVWGIDIAQEGHAERALRAALDLQAALRELGAGVFTESDDEPLPLKIGVHTGMALITPVETVHAPSLQATGVALTLAQKLADAAEGIILISPDTYRAVQGVFDVLEDVPLKLRGRKEPLQTYRVTAAKARAFRVKAYEVLGVPTACVGRENDLKQLMNAYLNALEETETQAVTILGEVGVGKSRLLYEFGQWYELRPEKIRFFQGRATPAMTQRPYALWRDVLSFRFEILDDDPLPEVCQKMEQGVAALLGHAAVEANGHSPLPPDDAPNDVREMAHLMGFLAGFDFSDSPHIKGLLGDPKQLANRAKQLAFRFFEKLGQIDPVIVELEDVHYADDTSLDLFTELPNTYPALPLTLIYLARPTLLERRPAWGNAQSFHKRLTLGPLDKRESRDLAREILQKIPDPPKALRDLLVERAEGNPLFMEELVRLLVDDCVITVGARRDAPQPDDVWRVEETRLANLRLPPSLIGLLQTRVDTLLAAEKLTLQRAAVFGRAFPDTVLPAINAADEFKVNDLPAALKALEARGFIQRRENSSFAGTVEYAFAQGLLREMLYLTLLERQRHTYHAACAAWLVQSERAEEYLPLIAAHYEKAGDTTQAAVYLQHAGDQALQRSSFADALTLYQRAQSLISYLQASALLLKLAEAHYHLGDFPAARAAIEQAQATATTDADRAAALAVLGDITSELGDYAEARTILAQAVPLAQASGDQRTLCRALYGLGDVNWRLGKLEDAKVVLSESLSLARALGDVTRELFALNRLGTATPFINLPEKEQFFTEVHTRAVAAGNRERAAAALNNLGEVYKERKDYVIARDKYQQALALAREIGVQQDIALYLINLADVDIKLGQLAAAREKLREGLALAQRLGVLPWMVTVVHYSGFLAHAEEQTERALALWGLARRQPMWHLDYQHELDTALAEWALDPAMVEAGLAKGAELDWETTIQELLKE